MNAYRNILHHQVNIKFKIINVYMELLHNYIKKQPSVFKEAYVSWGWGVMFRLLGNGWSSSFS